MKLISNAFTEGDSIPKKFTCDGHDVSPTLSWKNAPENAETFALIADDPDAPTGTFVHWVIFNIPGTSSSLSEEVENKEKLPDGAVQGINDFGKIGYGGPCPPGGTHRYYFKLYALNTALNLQPGASKSDLLEAMEGHIVAEAQLMGRYTR